MNISTTVLRFSKTLEVNVANKLVTHFYEAMFGGIFKNHSVQRSALLLRMRLVAGYKPD
jgi:hypothetical protein